MSQQPEMRPNEAEFPGGGSADCRWSWSQATRLIHALEAAWGPENPEIDVVLTRQASAMRWSISWACETLFFRIRFFSLPQSNAGTSTWTIAEYSIRRRSLARRGDDGRLAS